MEWNRTSFGLGVLACIAHSLSFLSSKISIDLKNKNKIKKGFVYKNVGERCLVVLLPQQKQGIGHGSLILFNIDLMN
jgi:hypothetical protein